MPTASAPVIAGVAKDQPTVVAYALREAMRLGVPLRIVHCRGVGESVDEASAVLRRAEAVVRASGSAVALGTVTEEGEAGAALLAHAEGASALVVGVDGASWLHRMLAGDVSGVVAVRASCPVTLVPGPQPSEDAAGVVVTIDGDTSAAGPLRYGLEQAEFRAEDLHVVHATPAGTSAPDTAVLSARVRREVARWNRTAPAVTTRLSVTNGDSLQECLEATAHASLLVIGRPHGSDPHFGLARPVALLVLREARCAVVVVPGAYGAPEIA